MCWTADSNGCYMYKYIARENVEFWNLFPYKAEQRSFASALRLHLSAWMSPTLVCMNVAYTCLHECRLHLSAWMSPTLVCMNVAYTCRHECRLHLSAWLLNEINGSQIFPIFKHIENRPSDIRPTLKYFKCAFFW